jgi:hypothetical protein
MPSTDYADYADFLRNEAQLNLRTVRMPVLSSLFSKQATPCFLNKIFFSARLRRLM